jgi:hypothetical protein
MLITGDPNFFIQIHLTVNILFPLRRQWNVTCKKCVTSSSSWPDFYQYKLKPFLSGEIFGFLVKFLNGLLKYFLIGRECQSFLVLRQPMHRYAI